MEMKIIREKIKRDELRVLARQGFGDFVKAVVDLERRVMTVGGELHADGESLLLEQGSRQENLWGVNLYPDSPPESWIEFNSMVNIKPSQGNRSRDVEDEKVRGQIAEAVSGLIE